MGREYERNEHLRAARERLASPSGAPRPMSRQELADAVNAYLWQNHGIRENLDQNDIGKMENGRVRWPREPRRRGLRAVLAARTDAQLGFYFHRTTAEGASLPEATTPPPASPSPSEHHAGAATLSRVRTETPVTYGAEPGLLIPPQEQADATESVATDLEKLLGQAAADALEFTCRAEASELGTRTFEHLESVATAMAHTFASTQPGQMFPAARWYRQRVDQFIQGRQTLRQRRELYRYAAWFSTILGWLSNDLGNLPAAEAHFLDAWEHAWQANDGEICGWVMDATATMAMYSDQPERARDAALKGLAHASQDSPAAVRLACQLTRAYGRLGHADDFDRSLADTYRSFDQLARRGSGLFSADAGRIASYAATSSIWLSRPAQAVDHAHKALTFYTNADLAERSPTREAISRLDLALALITMNSPDGAAEQALSALECERVTGTVLARAARLDNALTRAYPEHPSTREVHDRYLLLAERHTRGRQLTA